MSDDPAKRAMEYLREHSTLVSTIGAAKTEAAIEDGDDPAEGEADGNGKRPKKQGTHRNVTQTHYLGYQETVEQNPVATVKAIAAGDEHIINGGALLLAEDLSAGITQAREAGNDPSDLTASLAISRPGGQYKLSVSAKSLVPNPSNGERHETHGRIGVRARVSNLLDDKTTKQVAEQIGALMGDGAAAKPAAAD